MRYVVIADDSQPVEDFGRPPLREVDASDDLRLKLYENPSALPRARWVPEAIVVPDAVSVLRRLSAARDDPRAVLLLEAPPPSGFLGAPSATPGRVTIERNEPERVTLRVSAPTRGFVQLADQYYPGWRATVNGEPAAILRADFLFRAVEVPGGESVVEFRYRPASVAVGAAISAATLLMLVGAAAWRGRWRPASAPPAAG